MKSIKSRIGLWPLAAVLIFVLAACSQAPIDPPVDETATVTVNVTGNGSVASQPAGIDCPDGACTFDFDIGETVTLTATTDDPNNTTVTWGGACATAVGNSCSFEVTDDTTVTVEFVTDTGTNEPPFTLAVNEPTNGTVTGNGINCGVAGDGSCSVDFNEATEVTLTAQPDTGFEFAGWTGATCTEGNDSTTCTFTVDTDLTVSAAFEDPTAPQEQEFRAMVNQGSDDAEEFLGDIGDPNFPQGTTYINSSDLELTYDAGSGAGSNQMVGVRFTNVTVPAGATITGAYIQFTADASSTSSPTLTVQVQDDANPATFTDGEINGISGRAVVQDASVQWTPAAWVLDRRSEAERTADLSTLVQAVVDMQGWAEGNAIAFIISGPNDSTIRRIAESFDGDANNAPELVITYQVQAQ